MEMHGLFFWAIIFNLSTSNANKQGEAHTACDDITVARGNTAAITCRFGRDVSQSKHNIDVQFYSSSSNEPVSLLKCNWLVRMPDEPTCTVHSGCSFNASVNDTLRIEISHATEDFEGKYRCQLVPSDGIPAHLCRLTVTDGNSPQEDHGIKQNGTVTFNNDSKLPEATRKQPNVPAIVLGISVIILVVVNVTILILWRRERKSLESSTRSSSNRKPSLSKCTPMLGVDKTLTI